MLYVALNAVEKVVVVQYLIFQNNLGIYAVIDLMAKIDYKLLLTLWTCMQSASKEELWNFEMLAS